MLSNLKTAGRASRGGVQRQLPVLLNEQGQPAATRADRDKLRLSHFGQQECGDTITTSDFLLMPHKPVAVDETLEWKLSVSSSCASCSVMPCSPIHLDGRGGSSAFLLLPRSPKLGERGSAWLVSPSSSSVWVPSWMAWVPPKYACCHASSATKVWTAGPIASPPMKGTFTRSPSLSLSLSLGSLSACVL